MAAAEWDGVTQADGYREPELARRHELADAARTGNWDRLLNLLASRPSLVNAWRPGGTSWFTPVHQAAWFGAEPAVVRRLLALKPWLTLRTRAGDRAADIAARHGHAEIAALLLPTVRHPIQTESLAAIQGHFHDLIRRRVGWLVDEQELRLPELDPLTEMTTPDVWFAVSGMYGGFHYRLSGEILTVRSWMRVVEGSGEEHEINQTGVRMVREGFV